jgi:hypothetical protein
VLLDAQDLVALAALAALVLLPQLLDRQLPTQVAVAAARLLVLVVLVVLVVAVTQVLLELPILAVAVDLWATEAKVWLS